MKHVYILFLIILTKNIICFNIDTNYTIVYSLKTNESSLFGYSLVLYPESNFNRSWILIGAPKANNPNNTFKNSGACFKCDMNRTCNMVHFDEQQNALNSKFFKENLNNSWIGGSMDVNYKTNHIVTCAYRWIKAYYSDKILVSYRMQGSCYWFHVNNNNTKKFFPLVKKPSNDTYQKLLFYYAGQAGFSIHMPQKKQEILLGAPGVLNWQGTSILYTNSSSRSEKFNYKKSIGNSFKATHTSSFELLGYSSTSGYYYTKEKLLYASGAPKSSEYKGQVIIYVFQKNKPNSGLLVKQGLHGSQFGEYFGASITSGDINQDGLDDLIIGAPYFTSESYNEGKVYIFVGGTKKLVQQESIIGKITNGQFGSTVQYLGDIDQDGFGDIAVAAPFEQGSGVVYIFRGSIKGLEVDEYQRIVGKNINPNLKGFGMSISRPADIDFNGYLDIAIGTPLSNNAILLRTRPTVTIVQSLESLSERVAYNQTSFEIKTCFWYKTNLGNSNISFSRELIIDQSLGRAILGREAKYNDIIHLKPNETICHNLTIALKKSASNSYDPITVTLSHTFITNDEHKGFCASCPIYNKYKSNPSTTITIPYALGCEKGNVCEARLNFTSKIMDIGDTDSFILGSKNDVTLQTKVKNFGENAYLTELEVLIPEIVNFRRIHPSCSEQQNTKSVRCSISNPLPKNEEETLNLDLDMSNLNKGQYNNDSLTIVVTVYTSSYNQLPNRKELLIKLIRESDITISGKSGEQSYSYRKTTKPKPSFAQSYQVESFGPSPLNQILVEIKIPHVYKTKAGESVEFIDLYAPSGDQDINCESNFTYLSEENRVDADADDSNSTADDNDSNNNNNLNLKRSLRQAINEPIEKNQNITKRNEFNAIENRTLHINCSMPEIGCSKVRCLLGSIKKGQVAKIKFRMIFDISVVQELLRKKDVILFATQGAVSLKNLQNFVSNGNRSDRADVFSLFIGETTKEIIAIWIVILSVVAGVLLFLLMIVALFKCGFFKRATKEELKQLKKEIELNQNEDVDQVETTELE